MQNNIINDSKKFVKTRSQALKAKRMRRNIILFTTVGAAVTVALIGVTVFNYFNSFYAETNGGSKVEAAEVDETFITISMAVLEEDDNNEDTVNGDRENNDSNNSENVDLGETDGVEGLESLETMLEEDFLPSYLLPGDTKSASGVYALTSGSVEETVRAVAEALNVEGSIISSISKNKNGVDVKKVTFGTIVGGSVDYSKPHVVSSVNIDESSVIYWTYSVGGEVDYVQYGEQDGSSNITVEESTNVSNTALRNIEIYSEGIFEALELEDYNTVIDEQNGVTVVAELLVDGEPTPLYTALFFDNNGVFYGAYGYSTVLSKIAEAGSVSALDAASRSNSKAWFGMAPANIYISHFTTIDEKYDNFQSTSKRLSDFISNGVNTLSREGLLDGFTPNTPSQTEAYGIIVEYYEDTLPDVESSTVLGFENVNAPVGFTLGEKLGDTMWLVESSEPISKPIADGVLTNLKETGYFTQIAGNYTVRFEDVYSANGEEVVLDEAEFTWVLFSDSAGNQYIAKGYFFHSSENPMFYSSVMAIEDKYINIQR